MLYFQRLSYGGEGGIRTRSPPLESVTYRDHVAVIAMAASIAVAHCPPLPADGTRDGRLSRAPPAPGRQHLHDLMNARNGRDLTLRPRRPLGGRCSAGAATCASGAYSAVVRSRRTSWGRKRRSHGRRLPIALLWPLIWTYRPPLASTYSTTSLAQVRRQRPTPSLL